MNVRQIPLRFIRRDGGTQARAAMDQAAITEYAEAMEAGASFPAVILFQDQDTYWLGDGFHRVAAAEKAGKKNIKAEIRVGTQRDARLHALGANVTHGIRRTNADKRLAVSLLLDDPEWGAWSSREISRVAGVSDQFVNNMRKERVPTVVTHSFGNVDSETVTDSQEIHRQMEDVEAEEEPPAPATPEPTLAKTPEPTPLTPKASAEVAAEVLALRQEVSKLKADLEEAGTQIQELHEENESMHRILDAEDLLGEFKREVTRNQERARVAESRLRAAQDKERDLQRFAKMWKRKYEDLEKQIAQEKEAAS